MQTHLDYSWNTGSIPPPDYYEYRIIIGPHPRAEIHMRPDYPESNPPLWTETFSVPIETMDRLFRMALELPGCPPDQIVRIGGGRGELVLAQSGKESHSVCLDTEKGRSLARAVRELVPEDTWKMLYEKFDRYRTSR